MINIKQEIKSKTLPLSVETNIYSVVKSFSLMVKHTFNKNEG